MDLFVICKLYYIIYLKKKDKKIVSTKYLRCSVLKRIILYNKIYNNAIFTEAKK